MFNLFHFGCFGIETITTSMSVGTFYGISQEVPLKWYIIWGLWAHSYCFTKNVPSPMGVKGLSVLNLNCSIRSPTQ